MAKVNVVNKQVRMDLPEIIKFQLITHCYVNNIMMSDLEVDCLTFLGLNSGEDGYELNSFCMDMAEKRKHEKLKLNTTVKSLVASPQTIRNSLSKLQKNNFIVKSGKGKKVIEINPELKLQLRGNILLNYRFIYAEPKES
jgi:hypothetical protein